MGGGEVGRLQREYEVKGEDNWLSSCKRDPRGESASTIRAATANVNSEVIRDEQAEGCACARTKGIRSGPRKQAAVRNCAATHQFVSLYQRGHVPLTVRRLRVMDVALRRAG